MIGVYINKWIRNQAITHHQVYNQSVVQGSRVSFIHYHLKESGKKDTMILKMRFHVISYISMLLYGISRKYKNDFLGKCVFH